MAAAIVRDGRVLAARRSRPATLAGGWEFPGGKVEDGETDVDALVREIREELAVDIAVGAVLGSAREGALELVLHASSLGPSGTSGPSGPSGSQPAEPVAGDSHDALRWLARDELTDVVWLPVDLGLLDAVRPLLT